MANISRLPQSRRVGGIPALRAAALAFAAACAVQSPAAEPGPNHARPRLIAERLSVHPGETLWIGVHFNIDHHWHLYWHGASDTGTPPRVVAWDLPPGWEIGELVWPAPRRLVTADYIVDYVYENSVTLLARLRVPADAPSGRHTAVTLAADLSWLVCEEACIPEKGSVSLMLAVAADRTVGPSPEAPRIREALARVPSPPEEAKDTLTHRWDGDTLVLHAKGATRLAFFPAKKALALENAARDGEAKSDRLALRFDPSLSDGDRVRGVVRIDRGPADQPLYQEIDLPGRDAPPPQPDNK